MAIKPKNEPLQDSLAAIREAILARLGASEDPRLEGLETVFYGQQQRIGSVRAPALWIVAEPYTPEPSGGVSVIHRPAYNIVALVKDTDPERGIKSAERLSQGAYDVLMEGRDLDGLVSLVNPGQIDPGYEAGSSQQIQFAATQLVFEFRRKE